MDPPRRRVLRLAATSARPELQVDAAPGHLIAGGLRPRTGFYADGGGAEYLRLSYCFPEPARIREGIRRLADVVDAETEIRATFGPDRAGLPGGAGPADLTGPAGGPASR